jgi:RNase adapter protein RapZ
MSQAPVKLIIVSGLSGSGKSVAMRTLEDLGFYCVDNLPATLLLSLVSTFDGKDSHRNLELIGQLISQVQIAGFDTKLFFFDTDEAVLIKRFSETRRKHPLSMSGLTLADAIVEERKQLRPLVALADWVIDTSQTNVHQLRKLVLDKVQGHTKTSISLLFESFAYKKGVPSDADFVFDVRCLPNPHWVPSLRPLSGKDQLVQEFFSADDLVNTYQVQVMAFIDTWLPRFEAETRSYLTVAFGCTGGRHRSVYMAETLAKHCNVMGHDKVMVHHRELE